MDEPVLPARRRRLTPLIWVGGALILGMSAPRIAEEIRYSLVRGELRARHDFAAAQLDDTASTADPSRAFRLVADRIAPSVVLIDTQQRGDPNDVSGVEAPADRMPQNHRRFWSQGQGSGVIVDGLGYVLTNKHVIDKAVRIEVKLADRRVIDNVTVVGVDELTDLAVLKIDATDLMPAVWGDSSSLEVGEWVVAVGNPYGLDHSVTSGIVSAKDRVRLSQAATLQDLQFNPHQEFIQTDVAVNPGNSGGPLLNLRGELVGITTAIVGPWFQGISFAVPSDVAHKAYDRILRDGKVTRGWLGVRFAEETGDPNQDGATIEIVVRNSPAEAAGLRAGDRVVEWNDKKIVDHVELTLEVAATTVGSEIRAIVVRDGIFQTLSVRVAARPSEDLLRGGPPAETPALPSQTPADAPDKP